jgi:hypothetical protein
MSMRDQLTNQSLKGLFKNNFDLANYAIKLARYLIKSGEDISVDDLLDKVRKNPHEYDLNRLEELEKADKAEGIEQ